VLGCVLCALAPALRVTSSRSRRGAKSGGRHVGAGAGAAAMRPGHDLALRPGFGTGLRGALLAVQLGLSIMLLCGAGLLLRNVPVRAAARSRLQD
jgi:hypothetical protein